MLSPRASGAFIASRARHVRLNPAGIQNVAKLIMKAVEDDTFSCSSWNSSTDLHPKASGPDDRKAADWCFFADSINFSFWTDSDVECKGNSKQFTVTYKGNSYNGWLALCALINRALDNGIPFTDAEYLSRLTYEQARTIFTGDDGTPIPMLAERRANLMESADILLDKFNGTFLTCVQEAGGNAQKLLRIIVDNFPSFRDVAIYEDRTVSFLKRAQILVADVFSCLQIPTSPEGGLETLSMFADYRVPQVLVHLEALEYSIELKDILRRRQLLPNGDQMEVEIRGCSIHAVELIVDAIRAHLKDKKKAKLICPASEFPIMFKKFTEKENVSGVQQLKSSVQKDIRRKILESYPSFEEYLDQVLPKKENFKVVKCHEHIELLASVSGEILFFKQRDGAWIPCLRLLHQYPFILPYQQVDKGAIKFVLSGANIMCPGLTSAGARMTPNLEKERIVAVMAEGKQHAVAIGLMKLSTEEIRSVNKGIGIENLHYLNDGLWQIKPVK